MMDLLEYEHMLLDNYGCNLLHYACRSGNLDLIKKLYISFSFTSNDFGIPPCHEAICHDFLEVAQFFEQYEGERVDYLGRTELMVAAQANAEDCVLYFIHD